MKPVLVYDLPSRIFHWLFAGLFLSAFAIAKLIDSESGLFSWHMLAGIALAFIVTLRLVWGLVGSKYARFATFELKPKSLLSYFSGILSGDRRKWIGHNPASSWAAVFMFFLVLGLATTGYLMSTGGAEDFEDLHELMANSFLIVAVLHVTGVILHTLRHKDKIFMSMISGRKSGASGQDAIESQRPIVAAAFVAGVIAFAVYLVSNYDAANRSLNAFGTSLQLGELEED